MKHDCEVIRDLLPLYQDDVCSPKSREMVEEHLKECEACKKELEEIKKEIYISNVILVVVLIVAAAAAGIAIYRWDQLRIIWMGADELEYQAYRAADGRIYFECNGREHSISIVESPNDPSEAGGESYVLRMGYNKAARDIKMTRPEMWGVLNGNYKRLELDGFGKEDNTVICRMADELPPATEEMERRIAEYDSMMEKSVG